MVMAPQVAESLVCMCPQFHMFYSDQPNLRQPGWLRLVRVRMRRSPFRQPYLSSPDFFQLDFQVFHFLFPAQLLQPFSKLFHLLFEAG
jgi:hypothetical protein